MFKLFKRLFNLFPKPKSITEKEVDEKLTSDNCDAKTKLNEVLKVNLNGKNVCITDFENTNFISNEYLNKDYIHYVFTGPTTHEYWLNYKSKLHSNFSIFEVYSDHIGKNFVDNNISLYVGLIFGLYDVKKVVLVSEDNDYKIMTKTLMERQLPFELVKPGIVKSDQPTKYVRPNFMTESYLNRLEKDILLIMGESTFISTNALNKIIRKSRCVPIDFDEIKYVRDELCRRKFLVKTKNGKKDSYKVKRKRNKSNKNWNQETFLNSNLYMN